MNHLINDKKAGRLRIYSVVALILWTVVTGLSMGINWYELNAGLLNQLKARAGEAIEKEVLYREWNARQGGVYAPITETAIPNPYLKLTDRDVTTTDGKRLTLINPAYMTRMVNELQMERGNIQTHLSSINPIRPENRADDWETKALNEFSNGRTEMWSYASLNGQPVFRSMLPFVVEKPCMKCHEQQGYRIGDIRGGISVAIPLQIAMEDYNESLAAMILGHSAVWLFGVIIIFTGAKKLAESWNARIEAAKETEDRSREAVEFINSTLDALKAHVVIIDRYGTILFVNEGWRRFAEEKGANLENYGLGLNYLDVSKAALVNCSPDGPKIANLIEELNEGKRSEFILEYPCHGPSDLRWFEVRGTMFSFKGEPRIVLSHEDVTRLRTSETRFRTFLELAPVGLWATDHQGENTYVSPNWSRITGMSAEKALGKGWSEGLHPDDRAMVYEDWKQAAANRNAYQLYFRFVQPGGKIVWVLCQALCILDQDNAVIEWLGTITDVTELKLVQEEMRQGKVRLLRELQLKDATNSILEELISPDRTLTDVALVVLEKAQSLTGSQHGYVNETDPVSEDQVSLTLTKMFGKGCEMSDPGQVRFPKGSDGLYPGLWGHALNSIEPFFTNDPKNHPASKGLPEGHVPLERFISMPVVYGDILVGQIALSNSFRDYDKQDLEALEKIASYYALAIEKKRAHRTREILNSALNGALEAVVIADSSGRIKHANPAFETITGYSIDEAIGKSSRFLNLSDDNDPNLVQTIKNSIKKGSRWHGVLRGKRKDGAVYHSDCSVTPVMDSDGRVVDLVAIIRDVSRELMLQEQLAQSQKMEAIGTLAGGIAHDFNNIIFAINGSAELALDKIQQDSPVRRYLEQILKSADRASDMVKQILTFSRQSHTHMIPLNIVPVVKDGLKFIRGAIPTSIEIVREIDANSPKIKGDPTQIYQVVVNLCVNAAHAMKDRHGKLSVSLGCYNPGSNLADPYALEGAKRYLRLSVADTGDGIPPEILKRVFEPYFTTKSLGEGTGLGLSVVHGIVQEHGGFISVKSEPGHGATFHVFFPVIDLAGEADEENLLCAELKGDEKILWVDDEEVLINVFNESLQRLGFDMTTTRCPEEALEIFRRSPHYFDLVITDLSMPKKTGLELTREIIAIRPDVPVILCTGLDSVDSNSDTDFSGIVTVLHKPITRKQLVMAIRKALDEKTSGVK